MASPALARTMTSPDFGWAALWAAVGAVVTGAFAWLVQRSKGHTDIEVAVLGEWQKLNGALADRLSSVEKEFADYRVAMSQEIERLSTKHNAEIDEMRKQHRAEMRSLRDLNEGLQRQIAQSSKSTASLLGRTPVTGAKDEGDAD